MWLVIFLENVLQLEQSNGIGFLDFMNPCYLAETRFEINYFPINDDSIM